MKYVVGFLFNKLCTEVALILKQRPEWQKDRFNGIGGKYTKFTENPNELMTNKGKKESGKEISKWEYFAELKSPQNTVFCYCAADEDDSLRIREYENDEVVQIFPVNNLPENLIFNCRFLIPMAIDKLTNEHTFINVRVNYNDKTISA